MAQILISEFHYYSILNLWLATLIPNRIHICEAKIVSRVMNKKCPSNDCFE